jgi:hypothetical protein
MDDVTTMVEKGLVLVRDHYARLSQHVVPNVDVNPLLAAHIRSPFMWDSIPQSLALASMSLAYSRYSCWYDARTAVSRLRRTQPAAVAEAFPVDDNEGPAMHTRTRTRTRAAAIRAAATRASVGRGRGLPRRGMYR